MRLAVRLTPRAGRDAVEGVAEAADGRLVVRLRVAAPAVEGAANKALIRFVAKSLDIPPRAVTILSGETGRAKLLLLAGDSAMLTRRIASWLNEN
nr:DUF167 family protein [Sphingomonas quercus]